MFNFNIKKTKVYWMIKWEKVPIFKFSKKIYQLLFSASLFIFSFLVYDQSRFLIGLLVTSISFFLLFKNLNSFTEEKLRTVQGLNLKEVVANPQMFNLAESLSFEAAKAILKGENNFGKVFYYLLKEDPRLRFIFSRCLLNFKEVKKLLKNGEGTEEEFKKVILDSLSIAAKKNHKLIESVDLFIACANHSNFFKDVLINAGLDLEDIENVSYWFSDLVAPSKKHWDYDRLLRKGTLAKNWAAGYTLSLDKYGEDFTEKMKGDSPEIISHIEEVNILERILAKNEKNNALIVGNPGSGRKSIIYSLAQRSLLGKSLSGINYKRVIRLDIQTILAQYQDQEEVEFVLDNIFREATFSGNTILLIDQMHTYVGEGPKIGSIDISGVISPFLQLPSLQIIGITDYDGLHKKLERNSSFLSFFEKVEVSEVTANRTLRILQTLVPFFEKKYNLFISYSALKSVVDLSERYLPALSFPEKAMDILDEVIIFVVSSKKEKIVLPKHVAKIITERTEIPVGEIDKKEKEVLINLEELIHQRIIGQEEAVRGLSTALRRSRSEIKTRKGPMGTFLFLGPTGVGKTETSKALAEFYFGSENKMIRLDMSEFQEIKDIQRLIGSTEMDGILTTAVRENPFSLILLDELEKANLNILNLFLQVLDEGHLSDSAGKRVDFKNTIIIATSNAGYEIILKALKEGSNWENTKEELLNHVFEKNIFRPEFINRFDDVVVFKPLTRENLLDIASLMISGLKNNLNEKGIDLIIKEEVKEKIVELSYNPKFGAREMRRVIQDKIENNLASEILSGNLSRGKSVEIGLDDFNLIIK